MVAKVTRWRPDTCECDVTYSWDTDDPEDVRVHTPNSVTRLCPGHASIGGNPQAVVEAVWRENRSVNRLRGVLIAQGRPANQVVDDLVFSFSGDGAGRSLSVSVRGGVSGQQRAALVKAAQEETEVPTTVT